MSGTRRRFLKQAGAAAIVSSVAARASFGLPSVEQAAASPTAVYKSRAPLATATFSTLPLAYQLNDQRLKTKAQRFMDRS